VAIVGGLLLGPIDLLAQRTLSYAWANLANSSAVWAIGAFGIGVWVRAGRWRPAGAGVVLLLVAVESYYLTATLGQNDDWSNLWTATTLPWLLFGILAGTLFGTAGAWLRGSNRWLRIAGLALPGAVLLGEAGLLAYRYGSPDRGGAWRPLPRWTGAISFPRVPRPSRHECVASTTSAGSDERLGTGMSATLSICTATTLALCPGFSARSSPSSSRASTASGSTSSLSQLASTPNSFGRHDKLIQLVHLIPFLEGNHNLVERV